MISIWNILIFFFLKYEVNWNIFKKYFRRCHVSGWVSFYTSSCFIHLPRKMKMLLFIVGIFPIAANIHRTRTESKGTLICWTRQLDNRLMVRFNVSLTLIKIPLSAWDEQSKMNTERSKKKYIYRQQITIKKETKDKSNTPLYILTEIDKW